MADIPVVMLTLVGEAEMGYVLGASEYLDQAGGSRAAAAVLREIS